MGRSRAAGAFIAVLILGALIDFARGGDLIECEPQRVTGDGRYWAYRIVDGRECWYPGRPGKPKNELFWAHDTAPSARQAVEQPEAEAETKAEIEPSESPSRFVAAPSEKPQTAKEIPEEWRAPTADQLLAFTCCWPELEESAVLPQPTAEEGQPPAWPLALLPLALYALWWIAKPTRGLRARAKAPDRVAVRRLTRLHRHSGRDGFRDSRAVSASGVVRESPSLRRDNEHLSSCRQRSTGLDESATSLFVLPTNEQQHVSLASVLDAPAPMLRPGVRDRLAFAFSASVEEKVAGHGIRPQSDCT